MFVNMAVQFAATYKIIVLGNSNVGKTCIVHRFCDERYYDTYISTIGEFPNVTRQGLLADFPLVCAIHKRS